MRLPQLNTFTLHVKKVAPSALFPYLPCRTWNSIHVQSRKQYGCTKKTLSRDIGEVFEGNNVQHAIKMLQEAEAVCFDVDSTVCEEEGIDVLASFCGVAEEVANLTKKAMGGSMLFQDAIKMRLDLMKPSLAALKDCLVRHPPKVSKGVKELIDILHQRGTHVYFVSGGFRPMIEPIARLLNVPFSRIYANVLIFDENGKYSGFDEAEPTCRDRGKCFVVEKLKERNGYSTVVMIGDGSTDMQARPPADAFIGYGGVIVRDSVREGADLFVYSFEQLRRMLVEEKGLQC